MFDSLSERLTGIFDGLTGRGALSEKDVDAALREIRVALLEADVALPAVKDFTKQGARARGGRRGHPLGLARPAGHQDRP
jgi:signal recognition particle GTPase